MRMGPQNINVLGPPLNSRAMARRRGEGKYACAETSSNSPCTGIPHTSTQLLAGDDSSHEFHWVMTCCSIGGEISRCMPAHTIKFPTGTGQYDWEGALHKIRLCPGNKASCPLATAACLLYST